MTFADIHTYTQLLLYINHETWDLLTWDLLTWDLLTWDLSTKQPLIPRQVSRVCPRLNWRITMSWMVLYCSETMRSIIETKTHYIYLRNAVRSRECNWVKLGCSVDESLSETTLRPPQAFTKVTSHILRLFNSNFWWVLLNINWRKNTRPSPPKTRENDRGKDKIKTFN